MSIRAILTTNAPQYSSQLTQLPAEEFSQNEVQIETEYSSVNYKDALAITGKGAILKKFPLIPGIDLSGRVLSSRNPQLRKGDAVIVTGCGLGENQHGGYSERADVPANWVIPLPENLTSRAAMILGTAGFTAALALWRMQQLDQTPQKGPIAITGASGGVGSLAVQIFSRAGFEVIAISGKKDFHPKLRRWGAEQVLTPEELHLGHRPLESARFAGVLDTVGGSLLAQTLAHTQLWGNVASVGLASSHELHTTVMPFILRGVSLIGVSSANCPRPLRDQIWQKLANDWLPPHLEETVSQEIRLENVITASEQMLQRQSHGRILVKLKA